MASDEGLNAYGAVTWGQFFVYQGFNERAGWMHTSSGVDAVDEYLETVVRKGDRYFYKYGSEERPVAAAEIAVPYKTDQRDGARRNSRSTARITGPSCARSNGKWVAIRLMQEPIKALTQSYTRTKAQGLQVVPADHGTESQLVEQHHLRRCRWRHRLLPRQLHSRGAIPASIGPSRWMAAIRRPSGRDFWTVDETPHLLNPKSGWLYNSNNWPWSAAGPSSPKKEDYPAYVETGGESARGLHAIRVLENKQGFHARLADCRGVRQLPHVVREAHPGADRGVGRRRPPPIR